MWLSKTKRSRKEEEARKDEENERAVVEFVEAVHFVFDIIKNSNPGEYVEVHNAIYATLRQHGRGKVSDALYNEMWARMLAHLLYKSKVFEKSNAAPTEQKFPSAFVRQPELSGICVQSLANKLMDALLQQAEKNPNIPLMVVRCV